MMGDWRRVCPVRVEPVLTWVTSLNSLLYPTLQVLQAELEKQQQHVNSLQNMVVVVDENNSETGEYE